MTLGRKSGYPSSKRALNHDTSCVIQLHMDNSKKSQVVKYLTFFNFYDTIVGKGKKEVTNDVTQNFSIDNYFVGGRIII